MGRFTGGANAPHAYPRRPCARRWRLVERRAPCRLEGGRAGEGGEAAAVAHAQQRARRLEGIEWEYGVRGYGGCADEQLSESAIYDDRCHSSNPRETVPLRQPARRLECLRPGAPFEGRGYNLDLWEVARRDSP